MDLFYKTVAFALVTAVICLFLGKTEKDIGLLLSMTACCVAGTAAFFYLEPVVDFISELISLSSLQSGTMEVLVKIVGITLLAEFAGTICADAGNHSLSKMLHLLGTGAILYLSIPVFETLTNILSEIIGEL